MGRFRCPMEQRDAMVVMDNEKRPLRWFVGEEVIDDPRLWRHVHCEINYSPALQC
jgi:hypothetical protein